MAIVQHDGGGGGGVPAAPTTFSMNGLISAITGVPEIVLDAGTVTALQGKLSEAQGFLLEAQAEMRAVASSSVGGSPIGADLAHHSKLADNHLRELIDAVNLGLDRFDSALAISLAQVTGADEQVAADTFAGANAIAAAGDHPGQGVSG